MRTGPRQKSTIRHRSEDSGNYCAQPISTRNIPGCDKDSDWSAEQIPQRHLRRNSCRARTRPAHSARPDDIRGPWLRIAVRNTSTRSTSRALGYRVVDESAIDPETFREYSFAVSFSANEKNTL